MSPLLNRHFQLRRKFKFEIWNRFDYYTWICHGPDLNCRLHGDSQLPQLVKKKSTRSRGLVWTWTWPPCPDEDSCPNLDPTCISPTSHFVCLAPTSKSVTKMTQICPILPQTFMGIIQGPHLSSLLILIRGPPPLHCTNFHFGTLGIKKPFKFEFKFVSNIWNGDLHRKDFFISNRKSVISIYGSFLDFQSTSRLDKR